MKTRLLAAVSAGMLSLSGLAIAQEDLGLKQLQDSATASLSQLNMDTSMVDMLTLDELAQIQATSSLGIGEQAKTQRITTILRDAEARIAAGGAVTPSGPAGDITTDDLAGDKVVAANVGAFLAQLGLSDEIDVDSLTTEQLLQVQLVQESSDGDAAKRMRIENMLLN